MYTKKSRYSKRIRHNTSCKKVHNSHFAKLYKLGVIGYTSYFLTVIIGLRQKAIRRRLKFSSQTAVKGVGNSPT